MVRVYCRTKETLHYQGSADLQSIRLAMRRQLGRLAAKTFTLTVSLGLVSKQAFSSSDSAAAMWPWTSHVSSVALSFPSSKKGEMCGNFQESGGLAPSPLTGKCLSPLDLSLGLIHSNSQRHGLGQPVVYLGVWAHSWHCRDTDTKSIWGAGGSPPPLFYPLPSVVSHPRGSRECLKMRLKGQQGQFPRGRVWWFPWRPSCLLPRNLPW